MPSFTSAHRTRKIKLHYYSTRTTEFHVFSSMRFFLWLRLFRFGFFSLVRLTFHLKSKYITCVVLNILYDIVFSCCRFFFVCRWVSVCVKLRDLITTTGAVAAAAAIAFFFFFFHWYLLLFVWAIHSDIRCFFVVSIPIIDFIVVVVVVVFFFFRFCCVVLCLFVAEYTVRFYIHYVYTHTYRVLNVLYLVSFFGLFSMWFIHINSVKQNEVCTKWCALGFIRFVYDRCVRASERASEYV